MKITVQTLIPAPIQTVWKKYTSPEDIKIWNAASDDWHTTDAKVDLRVGGTFSSRMEAKDGSHGFDFSGTYTQVIEHQLIEYAFGERTAVIEFTEESQGVKVSITFDPENIFPEEQQRQGWQAILDRFASHVMSTAS
jgi:uncharacterized protein YndB with AHSA1/START domain